MGGEESLLYSGSWQLGVTAVSCPETFLKIQTQHESFKGEAGEGEFQGAVGEVCVSFHITHLGAIPPFCKTIS